MNWASKYNLLKATPIHIFLTEKKKKLMSHLEILEKKGDHIK